MNRRKFLKALGVGAVGVVATPAILEALTPTRSIFLPPPGGWFRANVYGGKLHENLVQATGIPGRYLFGEADTMPRSEHYQTFTRYSTEPPQFLTNYFDPKLLEVLLKPMGPSIKQLQFEGWLDV